LGKPAEETTTQELREYLAEFKDANKNTYANVLKSLRVYFRDFKRMDIADTFKFPKRSFQFKRIPSREELQRFYAVLETPKQRALFLMYATSGLRRSEVASLRVKDIDFDKRLIMPNTESTSTKRRWISFFNSECEQQLREFIDGKKSEDRLFFTRDGIDKVFRRTSLRSGVRITPQMLREWFCSEMLSKGVQEVYVDAFCGRVPKSILARHYTDFSPERLKEIYDKAELKVLS
jgi:integrase